MKLRRDLSSKELIKILSEFGYKVSRQKGSHIRLARETEAGSQHVTIPDHNPLKLGTLAEILNQVSAQLAIDKEELLKHL